MRRIEGEPNVGLASMKRGSMRVLLVEAKHGLRGVAGRMGGFVVRRMHW